MDEWNSREEVQAKLPPLLISSISFLLLLSTQRLAIRCGGLKVVVNPPKKGTGSVLGERKPLFMTRNPNIRVGNNGRGNKNGGARWESDNKLTLPEDQVAPLVWIEVAKGSDGAESKWKVCEVTVG